MGAHLSKRNLPRQLLCGSSQQDDFSMLRLPTELLLMVFSYCDWRTLLNLAKVSDRLKDLAMDTSIWSTVLIHQKWSHHLIMRKNMFVKEVESVCRFAPVHHLRMDVFVSGTDLASILTCCPHLSSLTLTQDSEFTDQVSNILKTSCVNLKSLVLARVSSKQVNARNYHYLFELKNLEFFALFLTDNVKDKKFLYQCPKLKKVYVLSVCSRSCARRHPPVSKDITTVHTIELSELDAGMYGSLEDCPCIITKNQDLPAFFKPVIKYLRIRHVWVILK